MERPAMSRTAFAPILLSVGGALIVLGCFLPWFELAAPFFGLDTLSQSGLKHGAKGIGALVAGIVSATVGGVRLARLPVPDAWLRWPALVATLGAAVVAGIAYVDTAARVRDVERRSEGFGLASVGVGLWMVLAGAGLALIGAALLAGVRRPAAGRTAQPSPQPASRSEAAPEPATPHDTAPASAVPDAEPAAPDARPSPPDAEPAPPEPGPAPPESEPARGETGSGREAPESDRGGAGAAPAQPGVLVRVLRWLNDKPGTRRCPRGHPAPRDLDRCPRCGAPMADGAKGAAQTQQPPTAG